jgi:integrase
MTITWSGQCSYLGMNTLPSSSQPEGEKGINKIAIDDAINQLRIAKLASNRRPVYVKELVRCLKQFAKESKTESLSSVTASQIETYLASHPFCPATRKAAIARISTLFEFGKRRRWLQVNPCDEIEKPIIEWVTPHVFTPEECETLLRKCQTESPTRLAYLVLCLLVGCRPTEAMVITQENIKGDTLRVVISKVRARRIVNLMPSALAWLTYAMPFANLPMTDPQRRRCHRYFRRVLGLPAWKQDSLRHTAASYLLAAKPDAQWVSMQLGHSPAVLFRNYRSIVTKEEADRFWSILP